MKLKRSFSIIISIACLLMFIGAPASLVFSKGVCCADDAYLAVIAKNLSNGLGYTSTIQPFASQYIFQPYDPLVGTGPTIILPASLSIKIFGNTHWAPGLANIILWASLLVLIGLALRRYIAGANFAFFTFSFLFLSYSSMTYHYEHWYALLGEIPAALLIILGILYFYSRPTTSNLILTGILFSLAMQAKLISLIPIAVFMVIHPLITPRTPSEKRLVNLKECIYRLLLIAIGFSIPLGLFELWKAINLGYSGFIENWHIYLQYIRDDGARVTSFSLIELYDERSKILLTRFDILIPHLGLILMFGWLMIRKDENLRRLFLILVAIIIVYSFWWLFLSIGWPRYFIICLIIVVFTIALPILSKRPIHQVYLYFGLLVIFSSNGWSRLTYPFKDANGEYFEPTHQTQNLLNTGTILSDLVKLDGPIATEWWATAADLEYVIDTSLNFTSFRDTNLIKRDSYWVAVNTKFVDQTDRAFADLLDSCKVTLDTGIYIIANCLTDPIK